MAIRHRTPRTRAPGLRPAVRRLVVLGAAALILGWSTGPSGAADEGTTAAAEVDGEVRYLARDQRDAWTGRAPLRIDVFELDLDDLDGARVEAAVRVVDLRSGNALRDFTARATVFEAAEHPEVRFRLTRVVGSLEPYLPDPQSLEVIGELTVRGVTREVRAAATVLVGDDRVHVDVRFEVSLAAYGIGAPRLLTLVAEDAVGIEVDAWWPRDPGSTTTTR